MARTALQALAAADRRHLVAMMLQYINDEVVHTHHQINHRGAELFTGHRALLKGMENWLIQNGGSAFTPLPQWLPITEIPSEFNIVRARDNGRSNPPLSNLNPGIELPVAFQKPAICSFPTLEVLGNAINGWHGDVHNQVGGTMDNPHISPYAPIFWCYHAFIDEVYDSWESCEQHNVGNHLVAINLELLSDAASLPSGEVNDNLFKAWSRWSQEYLAGLK